MQSSFFNNPNLLPYHGEVYLFSAFWNKEESKASFDALTQTVGWKHEPIKIFGKEVMQPRLTAWYGDKAYTYSGVTMQPMPFTPCLFNIKQRIESVAGVTFNTALLNLYRDGQDSMGWHRDNEKELGHNPVIGSVSFGASRIFKLRDYFKKGPAKSIELTDGSFLLMTGETQHYWEHAIPKTSRSTGPRINITFRVIQ